MTVAETLSNPKSVLSMSAFFVLQEQASYERRKSAARAAAAGIEPNLWINLFQGKAS